MKQETTINSTRLRELGGLGSLTPAQLEGLAAAMTVKRIRRKGRIFDQGERADMVYLLLSGTVRISWVNQEQRQVLVSLLPEGEFFGLGSLLPQRQHPFHADAFSDCTVGLLKPERLVEILMGIPLERYIRSNDVLLGRIWGMLFRCMRGLGLSLRKRLALELLELAATFGVQDSRGTILTTRPTHEDLANSIGASRQRVTETLTRFERRRVITTVGRRLILNPQRLREIVEKG